MRPRYLRILPRLLLPVFMRMHKLRSWVIKNLCNQRYHLWQDADPSPMLPQMQVCMACYDTRVKT